MSSIKSACKITVCKGFCARNLDFFLIRAVIVVNGRCFTEKNIITKTFYFTLSIIIGFITCKVATKSHTKLITKGNCIGKSFGERFGIGKVRNINSICGIYPVSNCPVACIYICREAGIIAKLFPTCLKFCNGNKFFQRFSR